MTQPGLNLEVLPGIAPTGLAQLNLGQSKGSAEVGAGGDTFSSFLAQATRQVAQLRTDADAKVRGLMSGDGTDIHTAMIASQKADLSFELALAVRGKAVAAYQQLMAMQF